MEPFKNIFNKKSVKLLSEDVSKEAGPKFNKTKFNRNINKELESLELKERVRLISAELKKQLPFTYKKNIQILIKCLAPEESEDGVYGFMTWPFLQFVEDYGLEDFDTSFEAMYEMTKRFSAEFAIRPYLIKDEKKVFTILKKWKNDPNKHIRRLCSEGTRPNLPWGMKVPNINCNLPRNLKLLEELKDDSEEYVRRSVANHLNDISRLDEKLMLKTATAWSKGSPSKDRIWVVRHATRSLLKMGHPVALKLHGYNPKAKFEIKGMKVSQKSIKEGGEFFLSFKLINNSMMSENILLDYVIHFLKKDGSYSPKPFRLKDGSIKPGECLQIEKKIKFKKVTTRRHYKGKHKLSLQVNGQESRSLNFSLM